MIGCSDEMVHQYRIDDEQFLEPLKMGSYKVHQSVNCIVPYDKEHFLIGQELGHIDVLIIKHK